MSKYKFIMVAVVALVGCYQPHRESAYTADADYQHMTKYKQSRYVVAHPCLRKMSDKPYIVLFDNASSSIPKQFHRDLDEAANCLKAHKNVAVVIDGFASQKGNPAFNVKLSEKRAEAVKRALVKRGVNVNAMITHGHGIKVKHIPSHWQDSIEKHNRRANLTPVEIDDGTLIVT